MAEIGKKKKDQRILRKGGKGCFCKGKWALAG